MLTHHNAFRDLIDRGGKRCWNGLLARKADELAANLSHGEHRNAGDRHRARHQARAPLSRTSRPPHERAETRDTMELVRRIGKGLTILIVEHDMQVVMGAGPPYHGAALRNVLAEGTPAEIQQNPKVQEVYLKT